MYLKDQSYAINGAAMYVHGQLGGGFLESVCQEAPARTFERLSIPYEKEKELKIMFDGKPLAQTYKADFVRCGEIIVELKAVEKLTSAHHAQTINYLKATNSKLGLLYNFGGGKLECRRFVDGV